MKLPTRNQVKQAESPIEEMLLRELHILDIYPVLQFEIGRYRIDLALPEKMIAIECDGKEWHSSEEQKARDAEKDRFLRANGWQVVRFTGSEIYRNADRIAKMIIGQDVRRRKKHFEKTKYKEVDESILSGEELEDLYNRKREYDEELENYEFGKFEKIGGIIARRCNF